MAKIWISRTAVTRTAGAPRLTSFQRQQSCSRNVHLRSSDPCAARSILQLLSRAEWMIGPDMLKQAGGQLKRATIYIYLLRLEQAGFVRSRYVDFANSEATGPRRREYQITSTGRAAMLRDDI